MITAKKITYITRRYSLVLVVRFNAIVKDLRTLYSPLTRR